MGLLTRAILEKAHCSGKSFLCLDPVERGKPGTGALAGEDLHLDCYRKQ
jgi:hypothetical protein